MQRGQRRGFGEMEKEGKVLLPESALGDEAGDRDRRSGERVGPWY